MPVIFILMFTNVFGGAIEGALPPAASGAYVNWLIPGLIAQSPSSAAPPQRPGSPTTSAPAPSTGSGRC
jgi:hypothetical protein